MIELGTWCCVVQCDNRCMDVAEMCFDQTDCHADATLLSCHGNCSVVGTLGTLMGAAMSEDYHNYRQTQQKICV